MVCYRSASLPEGILQESAPNGGELQCRGQLQMCACAPRKATLLSCLSECRSFATSFEHFAGCIIIDGTMLRAVPSPFFFSDFCCVPVFNLSCFTLIRLLALSVEQLLRPVPTCRSLLNAVKRRMRRAPLFIVCRNRLC